MKPVAAFASLLELAPSDSLIVLDNVLTEYGNVLCDENRRRGSMQKFLTAVCWAGIIHTLPPSTHSGLLSSFTRGASWNHRAPRLLCRSRKLRPYPPSSTSLESLVRHFKFPLFRGAFASVGDVCGQTQKPCLPWRQFVFASTGAQCTVSKFGTHRPVETSSLR